MGGQEGTRLYLFLVDFNAQKKSNDVAILTGGAPTLDLCIHVREPPI